MSDSHTLRSRVPGQSRMSDVVEAQKSVPALGRFQHLTGASPLGPENRQWYRGALAELLVGDALDGLGTDWDVLHAVPSGPGQPDIDHIAIGPSGIFTISTKNHSGEEVIVAGDTMLANGQRQEYICRARDEAAAAASLLSAAVGDSVTVTPLIVIVGAKKILVQSQPAGAYVVSARYLVRWLSRQDRRLDGEEVATVSDVADRSSTWQLEPAPVQDTRQLHRDFAVLRGLVTSAARRRVAGASLVFLAICAAVWATVAITVTQLVVSGR